MITDFKDLKIGELYKIGNSIGTDNYFVLLEIISNKYEHSSFLKIKILIKGKIIKTDIFKSELERIELL